MYPRALWMLKNTEFKKGNADGYTESVLIKLKYFNF